MRVCVCTCVHVYVCVDNSLVPGRGAIMACLGIDSKQLLSQWEVVGFCQRSAYCLMLSIYTLEKMRCDYKQSLHIECVLGIAGVARLPLHFRLKYCTSCVGCV